MNSKRFYELVENRIEKIREVLVQKGKEYSTEDNKLHNFDRAAVRSDQIREKALLGMLLKHEISILDIVDNIEEGKLPSLSMLNEKIKDTIAYYILLEASITDRIEKKN